ncbi:MAG: glycosyltransferase family 2 protein, partial [Pseudomonadota bacterium]
MAELAIIIVNWNVRDLLADCLEAVKERTQLSPGVFETIVVDNASADGSVEMLRDKFPWVRVIEAGDNIGFAPGCQLGYEATDAPFVLLLNPDTVVHDNAIDTMLATIKADERIGVLGSRLLNSDGSFQRAAGGAFPTLYNLLCNYMFIGRLLPQALRPEPVYITQDTSDLRDIQWVSGASLLFRRSVVGDQIFAPDFFMFGEDMDLCRRVAEAGYRVVFSGRQTITHHHGRSFSKQPSMEVVGTVFKGPRAFFRRDRGAISLLAYDAILFVGYAGRWAAFSALSIIRPGREYGTMAQFCRRY